MSESKEQALPFFARYLEGQFCEDLSEEEMNAVQGGWGATTLKYPSDNEESHNREDGIAVTKKYPSDADEYVTHKYPSDGDDDIAVTQKYPSDADDVQ
ncbi:microviridin/marinostatin family tricyclic proteinase inhibitor [Fischerella sp. PCC 9605]|uniref:microviridin/marinostatin family tricyclic proteinase inhibitor n=1 Tax=Fischerella sp. PCC 9605 TaxID=1173024 RepID=UPI0004794C2B|nr:microviridin/marinostatin family tricyclic proteinase inhibitor [Fischerella sp. PCC 9605]